LAEHHSRPRGSPAADLEENRYANGLLRSRFGVSPPLPFTHGPAFWAKAALAAGVKKSGLLKGFRYDREVTWKLDPKAASKMSSLAQSYFR